MTHPLKRLLRPFWSTLLVVTVMGVACSSPGQSARQEPTDPAADSVADGLIESDTTVVDDDTLETTAPTRATPRK